MIQHRLELGDVDYNGDDVPVVVTAVAFGDPGIDIWINDYALALTVEQAKKLASFITRQYGGTDERRS